MGCPGDHRFVGLVTLPELGPEDLAAAGVCLLTTCTRVAAAVLVAINAGYGQGAGEEAILAGSVGVGASREMTLAAMLREAAQSKGNSGIGSATAREAELMGEAWVGPNWHWNSSGNAMMSEDGLRQYRLPTFKPNRPAKFGGPGYQANLEARNAPRGRWQTDAHLDIEDMG